MRVAALYDVHGNLPALEAVVADVRSAGADMVVVGGDVLPGPMPADTLACLAALEVPVRFIRGNGERIVLAQTSGSDISEVPPQHRDVIRWVAEQLRPTDTTWLASWPATYAVEMAGLGRVLFCHATPRNDTEVFTRRTAAERLLPAFAGVNAATVVCGHTHMQFDRMFGAVRVVNAGSVGMPFAQPRGAYWLLLGPAVELRRTDYDYEHAVDRIRASGCPLVEDLSVRFVLNPPAEAETLALFAPVEMRSPLAS